VARYDLPIAQTDLLRAKGGGATRGVAGAYQSTTLFSGSLGGGVGSGASTGGSGAGGILGGGINSVGSTSCCDPRVRVSYGWSNAITPLNYKVVSGVSINTTIRLQLRRRTARLSDGHKPLRVRGQLASLLQQHNRHLRSGTGIEPFSGVSQHLLRGFGTRANSRFIRIDGTT